MWLSKQRPIYIGRKFFKQGVVDLAWSPDGRALLAASTDGSVACFQFSPDELGTPVPQAASIPPLRLVSGIHNIWLLVQEVSILDCCAARPE